MNGISLSSNLDATCSLEFGPASQVALPFPQKECECIMRYGGWSTEELYKKAVTAGIFFLDNETQKQLWMKQKYEPGIYSVQWHEQNPRLSLKEQTKQLAPVAIVASMLIAERVQTGFYFGRDEQRSFICSDKTKGGHNMILFWQGDLLEVTSLVRLAPEHHKRVLLTTAALLP